MSYSDLSLLNHFIKYMPNAAQGQMMGTEKIQKCTTAECIKLPIKMTKPADSVAVNFSKSSGPTVG